MADDAAPPPPPPPPATFSSFINKNTSAKKFAPKAARRRPAAAAAAAAAGPTAASAAGPAATSAPSAEFLSAPAAPLPTPAPTQAPLQPLSPAAAAASWSAAVPTTQDASPPATAAPEAPAPSPPQQQPQPHAAPEIQHVQTQHVQAQHIQTQHAHTHTHTHHVPQPLKDDIDAGRSPKRRRVESPSRQSAPMVPVAVMLPPQPETAFTTTTDATPPVETVPTTTTDATPPVEIVPTTTTDATPPAETASTTTTDATPPVDTAPTQQKRGRRTLPWTAVNHPQDEGGEASGAAEPPAKKKRAPPKPRAEKNAPEAAAEGEAQEDGDEDEDEAEPTESRLSARATGKRTAHVQDDQDDQDGEPAAPPSKKPRKPSKDKGKERAEEAELAEGQGDQDGDAPAKPKRKPRAPKKRKTALAAAKHGSEEPKRRGRPPREDTPSDAEEQIIDPDMMCMDDLASRNIRVGKLSRREKEMRKIDWEAVKERRREEDARHISTKETQAAVDKLLESGQVEPTPTGPRYHVVDGRIELIQDSGTIDRERDADREIDAMLITEEDDLTTRITNRSFMKNNKRFPNEFVLPGQGKRWNHQSTDIFYQGLRSFGTDFQMIAHMFPGMTRRSIKTKFTREERENPEIVRDCLRGKSELASHWDHFLAASQMEEESFADADAIKRDLEEEEARMREQINEALKEKEEREKQKKLAGLTDDGDGAADNQNGKGKKKRKQKDKTVTFQEEGVEIVGEVDDDPNWGQE
ncbi:uncharacterized protein EKO05_0003184 [Ascochyta rabiei]|uniref:Chromatin binding n=1 Tax=Didymella rabiei TaxID=5454 RepID=A0A163BN46_DIDRA|nr:uncharacterized protein EKO05_0003184 [Ascochyta rabiei]KZM21865.1 chromatin binding [Ascochyta rabiei]UPX12643.1 hypothetical protein EKO05_0003184 [Ascochyta rabiei]